MIGLLGPQIILDKAEDALEAGSTLRVSSCDPRVYPGSIGHIIDVCAADPDNDVRNGQVLVTYANGATYYTWPLYLHIERI